MIPEERARELTAEEYVSQVADLPARELTRDDGGESGVQTWHVTSRGMPYFLKFAPHERYERTLAKDVAICSWQLHTAITRLLEVVHLEDGVLLRFEYFDGEHPRPSPERRRFYLDLSLTAKLRALNTIFEALAQVVNAGWIMVDFYEGNVLYNFRTGEVKIFDFEFFERADEAGGFVLRRERNPGSTRLMAPEEWVRGERIDQATNVYTLGRFAINAMCADVGDD